jgi:hypothetical protein
MTTSSPLPLNIGSVSQTTGTIAATGTYQIALDFNTARIGGIVQNNGANPMYIFSGGTAAAQAAGTAAGCRIAAAGAFDLSWGVPNSAYLGYVSIAGTANDVFAVSENTAGVNTYSGGEPPYIADLVELESGLGSLELESGAGSVALET